MVQWKAIADRLGLTLDDLTGLLKGNASGNVCQRLGLTQADVSDFIAARGDSANLMRWLGMPHLAATNEFMKALNRDQRIGLLVGILLARE